MSRLIDERGLRNDGRGLDEIRPIKLEVGILRNAQGSAYIEQGKNKILIAVYGPRETHLRYLLSPERMALNVRYHMSPFSTEERKPPQPSRREIEISMVLRKALESAILLEEYPRTVVDVYIEVLQADGGTRCTSITGASAALVDAGIPMRDLAVAVAVGKVDGKIVLDPNDLEDKLGEGDLPFAILPNLKQVVLLQWNGRFTRDELRQAIGMAMKGSLQIYDVIRHSLMNKYFQLGER